MSNLRIGLIVLILLMAIGVSVQGAEPVQNEATIMLGEDPYIAANLHLSPKFELVTRYDYDSDYDESDLIYDSGYSIDQSSFKLGVKYQLSEHFALQAGLRYDPDPDTDETDLLGYGGFDFKVPLGNNLLLTGFVTNNYEDEDWMRYESAIRIQMYPDHYLFVGVRGEAGDGAPVFDYNTEEDPLIFLRGDFSWQWNKFSINLRPMMHIKGSAFHDYDFKYAFNDRTVLVFNLNSLYDSELSYRLGMQFKY